jgi:hypothetical protein
VNVHGIRLMPWMNALRSSSGSPASMSGIHLTGRERGGDQSAQLGVPGGVHRQKRLRCLEHLLGSVAELHALAGAEGRRITRDRADVLVTHDRPVVQPSLIAEPEDVLGRFVARERRVAAQDLEVPVALLRRLAPEVQGAEIAVAHRADLRGRHGRHGIDRAHPAPLRR